MGLILEQPMNIVHIPKNISDVKIYTDGSIFPNPGYGGYAAVIVFEDEIIQLYNYYPEKTTNNEMECFVMLIALQYLIDKGETKNCEVRIISDSQFAINVLSGIWKSKANPNITKMYETYKILKYKFKWVSFEWVRGHSGDKYNEMANTLAEKGRKLNPDLPTEYRRNPYQKG